MRRLLIQPIEALPTRANTLYPNSLRYLERVIKSGKPLLPTIVIEDEEGLLTGDGNHRLTLALQMRIRIATDLIEIGDKYTFPDGVTRLLEPRYFSCVRAFRAIALTKGWKTFQDLLNDTPYFQQST
ncbi:MAG: hypothetical protein KKF56_00765 [Nanoarchaeota archaeon]|nr:hypothetical protein [Nanoarchaeota archaeon]